MHEKLHLLQFNDGILTYWDVVAVRSVSVTFIRKLGIVCDFGLGFYVFIGSVTHSPSSIV